MDKIKEVIVVEGKDDTKQVQRAVLADTFETNGSALSKKALEQIKKLQQSRGVIVFTDPDFNGERLRKLIDQNVPGVKHAFIRRDQGVPTEAHGSLGVEHASSATILAALQNVYTTTPVLTPTFSNQDLIKAGLAGSPVAKRRRERLGELLGIGYGNAKQLLKRLDLFAIDRLTFERAVAQLDQEGKTHE